MYSTYFQYQGFLFLLQNSPTACFLNLFPISVEHLLLHMDLQNQLDKNYTFFQMQSKNPNDFLRDILENSNMPFLNHVLNQNHFPQLTFYSFSLPPLCRFSLYNTAGLCPASPVISPVSSTSKATFLRNAGTNNFVSKTDS